MLHSNFLHAAPLTAFCAFGVRRARARSTYVRARSRRSASTERFSQINTRHTRACELARTFVLFALWQVSGGPHSPTRELLRRAFLFSPSQKKSKFFSDTPLPRSNSCTFHYFDTPLTVRLLCKYYCYSKLPNRECRSDSLVCCCCAQYSVITSSVIEFVSKALCKKFLML